MSHLTSGVDLLGLLCSFYVSIQKANDWRQNCTIRHLPLNSSELQWGTSASAMVMVTGSTDLSYCYCLKCISIGLSKPCAIHIKQKTNKKNPCSCEMLKKWNGYEFHEYPLQFRILSEGFRPMDNFGVCLRVQTVNVRQITLITQLYTKRHF